jgi:hypothetical protein
MRTFAVLVFWVIRCLTANAEIVPVAESDQAAQALKIIDAYHGVRPANSPKILHVVYFTPSDRDPEPRYRERLTAILEDIQTFYRDGMKRSGFGPKTFDLAHDPQGQLIIHLVKGKEPENSYQKPDGDKVYQECQPVMQAAGISLDRETVLIFCNLAKWDEKARTFSHHSPYYGMWTQTNGLCFAVDSVILNLDDISKKRPILEDDEYGAMSLGKLNIVFIGGVAHELGHAFALPHCGERWDEQKLGVSLMGAGNRTYREERVGEGQGSFLTMASAMRLAGRPLFNGSDQGMMDDGVLQRCTLMLSTNVTRFDLMGRRGAVRLQGTVAGSPPVYGVVAYFDSRHDGGYSSPAATAVPDSEGQFAIEMSDLETCGDGDLRVELCHANGAVSERRLGFSVDGEGQLDLSQWQMRHALDAVAQAVADDHPDDVTNALRELEKSDASALAKLVGSKLAGTIDPTSRPSPAQASMTISRLALGDAQSQSAEVGWLNPAANRVPLDTGVRSPLLDSGKLYPTGLYAHAPSRYVFDLGGKWSELSGEAGLHTLQQPYGSVIFIIKADGREVFRSTRIEGAKHASYKINVTGVKQLELIVVPAADNNHNDWGLWLDPTLSR